MESSKKNLIIVDDESHIRLLMKTAVKSMNCEVVAEGANGAEALALYREKRPDLMLLDINMPVRNGDEALQDIIAEFPEATVVMLTSVSDMDTVEQCLGNGASGYIRKDTPLPEIKSMISDILGTN
jgi:two-component system, chemotaxis family, chemotaxis protein CheY